MINIKTMDVHPQEGHKISATFFYPKGVLKGAVVIAPAMGVDQTFYHSFALWLAGHGYMVTTFDYSSMGASNEVSFKDSKVSITDWATVECKAILEVVVNENQGKPLYWIGHSLGGQIIGMIPNAQLISKVITIACGSGYWMENTKALRNKVWFLWYFVAPVLLKVFGHFPGKRLGMVGNLPFGVMTQWRKWCLHPNYLLGIENQTIQNAYQLFDQPITSFSFTDDELMSEDNVLSLHSFFASSKKAMHRFSPETINTKNIGHFGFFKESLKEKLWEQYLLPELKIIQ